MGMGLEALGRACKTIGRRVSVETVQLACTKPKWRTFMKPSGMTCWRNWWINSMASRLVVRGQPLGAIFGEATAWNDVMDVRVILELSPPGVQDTRKTREVGANEARVFGELFKGRRRRLEQGLRGRALMRAEQGT